MIGLSDLLLLVSHLFAVPLLVLWVGLQKHSLILHSYSTQNQQRPYQKLSEKWLLITSLSGCSLEQKLPSSVTHSPDRTRPGTPFLTSAIPGLRSALECRNLISSNSFAHRLGTGNSALQLAPGPVGLKPELGQGRSEFIYKIRFLQAVWLLTFLWTSRFVSPVTVSAHRSFFEFFWSLHIWWLQTQQDNNHQERGQLCFPHS